MPVILLGVMLTPYFFFPLSQKWATTNPTCTVRMTSKQQTGCSRMKHKWLNVNQINRKLAWTFSFSSLEIMCKPSLPSFLSLWHMEIWHLWQREKREQTKRWVTNMEMWRPAELFDKNPVKLRGRLLPGCAVRKCSWTALKRTSPLFTYTHMLL